MHAIFRLGGLDQLDPLVMATIPGPAPVEGSRNGDGPTSADAVQTDPAGSVASAESTGSPARVPPVHEIVGGSLVRQYLNKNLTAHLLAGLQKVAQAKPEDPLRFLGEFLIQRSNESAKE